MDSSILSWPSQRPSSLLRPGRHTTRLRNGLWGRRHPANGSAGCELIQCQRGLHVLVLSIQILARRHAPGRLEAFLHLHSTSFRCHVGVRCKSSRQGLPLAWLTVVASTGCLSYSPSLPDARRSWGAFITSSNTLQCGGSDSE